MTTIYSIGHSNHEPDAFLALLHQHGVELLVDVRSSPYSRYVPHANRQNLAHMLKAAGINYKWMGDRLGGKPDGVVADYDALAASPGFQQGVSELISLANTRSTAVMCSEGSHQQCHRYKLISPALEARDVHVLHIQPDGDVVDEAKIPKQLALF